MTSRLASAAALLLVSALPACASKNVAADRIVYDVHGGRLSPPMTDPLPAARASANRADEAAIRAWWQANRPAAGYVPAFDDSPAQLAAEEARESWGWGWWPSIGIGLGLGFGWGDCGDGWGVSLGVPFGVGLGYGYGPGYGYGCRRAYDCDD